VEAEPEDALPSLALGDLDIVLGDEWHQSLRRLPEGLERHVLLRESVHLVLPAGHPAAARDDEVPLAELAGEAWATGPAGLGWDELTVRICRERGGFEPDVRHRSNDAAIGVALVAGGLAVAMLPELARPGRDPGVVLRPIAGGPVERAIYAVTRATDAARPSTQALLGALRDAAGLVAG
jgi:DNA-binding transcriptional LysR family regulator